MTQGNRKNLRLFMQSAWNLARNGAKRFGVRPSEYIPMAMLLVWQDRKDRPESVYYPWLGTWMCLPGVERKVCAKRGQYLLPGIAL